MKKAFVLLILIFITNEVLPQFSHSWLDKVNKNLLYSNIDLMIGNSSGGNIGFTFVSNNNFSLGVGYSATSNQSGTLNSIIKSGNNNNTFDTDVLKATENYNIMIGRHFYLNHKGNIRFILQGGPGFTISRNMTRPENNNNKVFFLPGKEKDISVIINSRFEFPVIDVLGFSAGPVLIMNQDRKILTFNVGLMYGIISTN